MTTIIVEIELPDVTQEDININGDQWFTDPLHPDMISVPGDIVGTHTYSIPHRGVYAFRFVGFKEDEQSDELTPEMAAEAMGLNIRPPEDDEIGEQLRQLFKGGPLVELPAADTEVPKAQPTPADVEQASLDYLDKVLGKGGYSFVDPAEVIDPELRGLL